MIAKKGGVTKALFSEVFKKGKTAGTPFFSVKYYPFSTLKFSFVVPKSIAKTAVERNSLRRRGYEIIHKNKGLFTKTTGVYLFFIKKDVTSLSFVQFEEKLLFIINKLKV